MRGGPAHREHRRKDAFPSLEFGLCAVVFFVVVVLETLVSWFIRSKGVGLTGDEPSYIIQAQSYLHLSPQIIDTIRSDLARNLLSAYAPGTPVSAVAAYPGPHGTVSAFEPGLGILLIPFVAMGRLYVTATLGVVSLNTAGLILLHRRATRLARLGRRGQVLLALLLLAPAALIAGTQIYPDLVSGVLLACALVEIALIERRGAVRRTNTVVVLVAAGILPWLQVKNLAPALVVLVAFVVAGRRAGAAWRRLSVAAAPVVAWALLLLYNHIYYGRLSGLPEPFPRPSLNAVEYTLGLLFDRHQGLFVQVPFAVIGLLGLWVARKRLPTAVVASVVSAGSILLLNGSYVGNPYGGLSLAGRFMWTLLPVPLLWTAIVIGRWQRAGRLLWTPVLVVAVAWIAQVVPVLRGDHVYYNQYSPTPPWDPSGWPGWWPRFNQLVPQFNLSDHPIGAPSWALFVELALAAILLIAAWQYMRPAAFERWSIVAMVVLGAAAVVVSVVGEPLHPTTTLTFHSAQLGAPVSGGADGKTSPSVALQGVAPGTFRLTLTYTLTGSTPTGTPATGSLTASCIGPGGSTTTVVHTPLATGQPVATANVHCVQSGAVTSQLGIGPGAVLRVGTLRLALTGA